MLTAATVDAADLVLEPLRVGHATELVGVLDDPELYRFTGGTPPTLPELARRYTVQTVGRSPDGRQAWLNWIVREAGTARPLGFMQATVEGGTAEVAWVVGTAHQGRGVARAAAAAMLAWLRARGVHTVVAHVHPDHLASPAVARRLGLVVTGALVDGEVVWQWPGTEPPVTVRGVLADDVPRLLPFWAVAAEDSGRPADSDDAVRRLVARDPSALLVAVVGEVVVGTLIAGFDGWRCHLYRLAVHPSWRRRGIGRTLVDAAETRFAGFGAARSDAMVLDDNPAAHALWRSLGYEPQTTWSRWVKPL